MPSWKKIITSGSDATLNSLTVSTTLTANKIKTPTGTSNQFLMADGSVNSSTYSVTTHTHTFASITSKPTTLSGYGITDAEYNIPINTLRNNLGNPTVREIALFHGEFTNKFRFVEATLQEESTDGINWVTSTRATTNQLKDIMIGEGQTGNITAIPSGTVGTYGGYRLTWDVTGIVGYVILNQLYIYSSTNGNNISITIEAYHNTNGWIVITGPHIFNNWPGHTTIPHTSIPYSTSATQYSKVRITFSSTHNSNTNAYNLQGIEWFGGYPAGRRNVESYDRDKNVTFPAKITSTGFIKSGGTSTQYLMADGSVSTLTNNVTGTGTANYLSKFTSNGTIGNSIVYDNGTNVGIGILPLSEKLEVNGSVKSNSYKFNLPSSITAQPNMLIPKIDGTRPIWYNNSSVANDLAFKSDVDNLQIGGRNYFAFKNLGRYIGGNVSASTSFFTISGNRISINSNPNDLLGNTIDVVPGSDILIHGKTDLPSQSVYYRFENGTQLNFDVPTVNGRFQFSLTVPNNATYLNIGLGKYPFSAPYYLEDIKIEKGNKATDWTPAPEDKQDRLQDITGNIGVGKTDASATEKLDVNGNIKATSFIKSGGTSSQFLKADGSVDSNTYLTSATLPAPLTSFRTSAWAGTGGYPGYSFTGGNSRFGFSSSGGVVDIYADGNFYATDNLYRVWHAGDFSQSNINNWNVAYGWGNHATQGYLKSSDLNNYVTLDTTQTITGQKIFTASNYFTNSMFGKYSNNANALELLIQETYDRADLYIKTKSNTGAIRLSAHGDNAIFKLMNSQGEIMGNGVANGSPFIHMPISTARFTLRRFGDYLPQYAFVVNGDGLFESNLTVKGNVGIGTTTPSSYKLDVNGDTNINGTLTATVKSFIIDHPTKPNKKLQYGVLEGPEHSVYFRGKLKGTNKIILPDYWFALINEETITVNITPIGSKQNIWVVTTNAREIIVESETEINCFYTVFAERKDIDKLITEFDK